MAERALDSDELFRRILRVWNQAGRGDFPWAQEDRAQATLGRIVSEITVVVALGVFLADDEPALLVLAPDEARVVRVDAQGVETLYLGALAGGTLAVREEQVDATHIRVRLRYEHSRLPGALEHVAETEAAFEEQEQARAVLLPWSTSRD